MTVRDRDRGARRVTKALGEVSKPHVLVGVLGDDSHGPGVTVAQVAAWMEFGTGTVPPRSWLRGWVDEANPEITRRLGAELREVYAGRRTQLAALARFGAWAQGQIQLRIARGIPPELAESTIAAKGSSVPLIDTGQLRSSITNKVVP